MTRHFAFNREGFNINRGDTVYTQTARFDGSARALTEDELRTLAPSVFATDPHASRSERFRAIPTIEILRGLVQEGFAPVGARQAVAREPGRAPFTKHLIRLRKLDDKVRRSGDTVVEALLKNANDGTAAYALMAGLFRIVCANSLVTKTETIDEVKVAHSGDVQSKVIEGTFRVLTEAEKALVAPDQWSQLKLARGEAEAFAKAAHALRFADAQGEVTTAITADQLLLPRRQADTDANLWNVFNVVQENAIKGGLHAMGRDANNRLRQFTSRQIKGIDQDVKLNKALWVLAEEMAKLKQAA
jgi:hypothetical protein